MHDTPTTQPPTKRCSKCGVEKERGEFAENRAKTSGLQSHCRACQRSAYATRVVADRCADCGVDKEPGTGTKRCCANCARKRNVRGAARTRAILAAGLCQRCCDRSRITTQYCRVCWFAQVACARTGASRNGPMLERLWTEQDGRCALTDVPLTIGAGASLDHIVPVSKGGSHDASNLRWVTHAANTAKSALSDDEFLALCQRVVDTAAAQRRPHLVWSQP